MRIYIYNTLSRKKEFFDPIQSGTVRMYVCGPTVYDSCHIGHARSVVVFDAIHRFLEAAGYTVVYVRNFTDIDDKIIKRSLETGKPWDRIAEEHINEFKDEMAKLYVLPPDHEPRATWHIDDIIEMVAVLLQKGHAYETEGDIYFAVDTWPEYGKLSGRKLEDMEAGARVAIDPKKRNPFDFALWKAAKPGEPSWESPWGRGRPGWHIECSAMSAKYLGKTFDIHGGGKDLIFPHHENEIAQSEAAFGTDFVRYWVHNGFVNIDKEKMSKSLGNFLRIKDVLEQVDPEALRLFLLSNHYRSPVDYTPKALTEAAAALDKIYTFMSRIENHVHGGFEKLAAGEIEADNSTWQAFCDSMCDDFNTAKGIGILFDALRLGNRLLDEVESGAKPDTLEQVSELAAAVQRMGGVLGILNRPPSAYFAEKRDKALETQKIDPAWIEDMIGKRSAARKARNFKEADSIRDQLLKLGIILEDHPDGTTWRFKS